MITGLGWIVKIALLKLLEATEKTAFLKYAQCSPEMYEHFLEFDTLHDCRPVNFDRNESSITIKDLGIPVDDETNIADLPLDGFDIVIDCAATLRTGKALAPILLLGYITWWFSHQLTISQSQISCLMSITRFIRRISTKL